VPDGIETIWLWLFSSLIFPGAHPPDETLDNTGGATSGRTKDGEVDQSTSEASSGVRVPFHWRFLCLDETIVSLDRGLPLCRGRLPQEHGFDFVCGGRLGCVR
jgi:hypothetical protein